MSECSASHSVRLLHSLHLQHLNASELYYTYDTCSLKTRAPSQSVRPTNTPAATVITSLPSVCPATIPTASNLATNHNSKCESV